MRLLALTPIDVPDAEVARRQARYDAIAPAGVTGRGAAARTGGLPPELGSAADIATSDAALLAAYAAEPAGDWDGFLPDCVLDPARPRRGRAAASRSTASDGSRCMRSPAPGWPGAAVARNEPIAHELDRLAARYGLTTDGPTIVLSLCVEDIADDVGWASALSAAVADLALRRGPQRLLRRRRPGARSPGPAVVDPTALALRVLAASPAYASSRALHERSRRSRPRRRGRRGRARRRRCVLPSSGSTCSWSSGRSTSPPATTPRCRRRWCPGAGSRWQREAGHRGLARPVPRRRPGQDRGRRDERIARALVDVSARLVEWLADDLGLDLVARHRLQLPRPLGAAVPHRAGARRGGRMLDDLVRRVRRDDRVDLMVPATLVDVLVADHGRHRGRRRDPQRPRGDPVPGGAAGHQRLRRRRRPRAPAPARDRRRGLPRQRRLARRRAADRGAARRAPPAFLDAYQGHAALAHPAATLPGWATVMHGGFLVDRAGRRFGDETTGYSRVRRAGGPRAPTDVRGWCSTSGSTRRAWPSRTSATP